MMHYKKGRNVEEELTKDNISIECLKSDFLWMHVKGGTQVPNVIEYAKKAIDSGEHRNVLWTGSGGGVVKTISCAEILKRAYNTLHQVTRICYRKVEEYWDPQMEGLEQIVITRQIPCIHILLSLDEIDPKTPGYQHSSNNKPFPNSQCLGLTELSKQQNQRRSQPGTSGRNNNNRENQRQRQKNKKQDPQQNQRKPKTERPKDVEKMDS